MTKEQERDRAEVARLVNAKAVEIVTKTPQLSRVIVSLMNADNALDVAATATTKEVAEILQLGAWFTGSILYLTETELGIDNNKDLGWSAEG